MSSKPHNMTHRHSERDSLPKKSLGQNFLLSEKAVEDAIKAAGLVAGETVLEIGPGNGMLTKFLLAKGAKVLAVEKDEDLAARMPIQFEKEIESGQLEIIVGDVLTENFWPKLADKDYKLIANIPYYITGAIIKLFLTVGHQPSTIVLMVQKEVAERIVAKEGKESILSLSVKAYGTPEIVRIVPRQLFNPIPEVDSALIAIKNVSRDFFKDISEKTFFSIVRAGFSSKRKFLSNNLSNGQFTKEELKTIFTELHIAEDTRAEDLPLETWKEIVLRKKI